MLRMLQILPAPGTRIPHKHTCRIYIKQQKSKECSHHRTGNRLNSAFCSNCDNRKECCNQNRNTGCQAVQSICKIHTIYGSDHYKEHQWNCQPSNVQISSPTKRNQHCKWNPCKFHHIKCKDCCYHDLKCHLLLWI